MNAQVVDDVRRFLGENVIDIDFMLNFVFRVKYLQVYRSDVYTSFLFFSIFAPFLFYQQILKN